MNDVKTAVYCVGSTLMLDDGIGPAVYEQLAAYDFDGKVDIVEIGCLSMDRLNDVASHDLLITVDALDDTGSAPGTVFRFTPDDMARRGPGTQSLHDLKLSDLFDAAELLGYTAEGVCFGMQVGNRNPDVVTIGLTPPVIAALPKLVDCVLAELVGRGIGVRVAEAGQSIDVGCAVEPGYAHTLRSFEGTDG